MNTSSVHGSGKYMHVLFPIEYINMCFYTIEYKSDHETKIKPIRWI
jgi:hypothetical protein